MCVIASVDYMLLISFSQYHLSLFGYDIALGQSLNGVSHLHLRVDLSFSFLQAVGFFSEFIEFIYSKFL